VLLAILTRMSMTALGQNPTMVASAAGDVVPKKRDGHRHRQLEEVGSADIPAGAAMSWGSSAFSRQGRR
jgi:hypothetical protein